MSSLLVTTHSADRDLVAFWDRKDSYSLDARVTEVEDVFEDSRSELQEETSLHVEENKSGDKEEEEREKKEEMGKKKGEEGEKKEKGVIISEERLNINNDALSNEFLRQEEKEEDVAKVYGLFNSTSNGQQASINAKKMRRRVPANLSTAVPVRSSPGRRRQLLPLSPSAAVVKERSLFKVEVCLTRLQEKMAMKEVREERKKVPQFGLLNPNISRRAKRSFKSEGMDVRRRKKMRIVE